jgi:ribose 5-phosphate isomerase B
MKIAIGSDHAGYEMKEFIKNRLSAEYEIIDCGTYSAESADYPDFAHKVANLIVSKDVNFGILMCGSGNGVNIVANKHKGVRSVYCWMPELAELGRKHNDANAIALPARFIANELALEIVKKFLITDFEGGRHERRVGKIE